MQAAKSLPGLVAGLLFFDLLINLPGFSTASPVASLLAPSIDLLVVSAALVGIAQAAVALLAVLQVISGHRILAPSAIPRLVREIGSLFK
jgi:hypothetical protein